ncbi:hypothetical protein Tco_1511174, partial [Tanacetum coccineum]
TICHIIPFNCGSTVKGTILDVVKKERLVDLSLKPELIYMEINDSRTAKKVRKRSVQKDLEVHQTVNAVVEIVFGAESSSFHDLEKVNLAILGGLPDTRPIFLFNCICDSKRQMDPTSDMAKISRKSSNLVLEIQSMDKSHQQFYELSGSKLSNIIGAEKSAKHVIFSFASAMIHLYDNCVLLGHK